MQNPRLASRYAKSLLDIAIEQNSMDATLKDVQLLNSLCHESRDFVNMLRSPIIKVSKKQEILNAILNGHIGKVTQAFVNLLVSKGREMYLPEIAHAFIAQYKEMHNIKTVKLTTAVTVDDSIKEAIRQKVASGLPNSKVELHTHVNPELIGGFVLEMEDKLFDASVRRDLHDIREQLLDNSYVSSLN